ncbi:MAG: threonine-phosphate decarboxylase CobD [Methanosarcinaceae archaeon]|nr:threonine-phosphate decarboxylase CobD [Methanosarcinaceae archaeon]
MSEQDTTLPLKREIQNIISCTHGGLVKKTAQKHGILEQDMLDLSASLNPIGSPFEYPAGNPYLDLHEILQKAIAQIDQYPDNRYIDFRNSAAGFVGMGVQPDNIIPGNGSSEVIRLVAECVIEKDDIVLIPQPTFSEYEQQCRIFGANVIYVKQDEITNITDDLLEKARILFVCNPNNPTGILMSRKEMLDIVQRCEKNKTLLFVDEAFIELSDPMQSVADIAAENDYVFVLRSLTKSFAIPGIRIGFGIASFKMAQMLDAARLPWNLGSIPDMVGTKLLGMDGGCNSLYLTESRELIKQESEYLTERLSNIRGFSPLPSGVNYILVDVSDFLMDSVELTHRLASHGILIRDCSSFYSLDNNYVRIAVRSREENDRLMKMIGEVLNEWGKQHAEEELKNTLEAVAKGMHSGRDTCEYYPCHFKDQDCTFCFCPFYACEDGRTGGKWIERSSGGKVWSCVDCHIMHNSEVSQRVLDVLMNKGTTEDNLKTAWESMVEPLL